MSVKKAPYINGDLTTYVYEWAGAQQNVEWRDNVPFEARMRFESFARGRSAARFTLSDDDGHKYPMFMSDATALLKSCSMSFGRTPAYLWRVVKRGENYGLQRVTFKEPME